MRFMSATLQLPSKIYLKSRTQHPRRSKMLSTGPLNRNAKRRQKPVYGTQIQVSRRIFLFLSIDAKEIQSSVWLYQSKSDCIKYLRLISNQTELNFLPKCIIQAAIIQDNATRTRTEFVCVFAGRNAGLNVTIHARQSGVTAAL